MTRESVGRFVFATVTVAPARAKVVDCDHTAIEIPCNVVTHADGQRLGREPAALLIVKRVFS